MSSAQIARPLIEVTDVVILLVLALGSAGYLYWRRTGATDQARDATVNKTEDAKGSSGPKTDGKRGKKSILEVLRATDAPNQLVFFYGSQTGTAEDLATRFAKEATATFGVPAIVCDCEDYNMNELASWPVDELEAEDKKWLVGFFVATYGEGEPTDNAVEFYDWLMDGKGKGDDEGNEEDDMTAERSLEGVPYIIFGLGNKTYEHYNAIARRMDKRMKALGAQRVGERGEGDDDASLEEDFLAWKPKALQSLEQFFGIASNAGGAAELRDKAHVPVFQMVEVAEQPIDQVFWGELSAELPRRWRSSTVAVSGAEEYEIINSSAGEKYVEIQSRNVPYDMKHPHYGRIVTSKPLFTETYDEYSLEDGFDAPTAGHKRYTVEGKRVKIERHCLHIELDLQGSGLRYESGDHVGIWPINDEDEASALANALKLSPQELDTIITLKPNPAASNSSSAKLPFPLPCTLRTALLHYLDVLGKYAKDPIERAALFELADNRELYVSAVEKSQKNLREILSVFPSVELPIAVVIGELLPRIAVRYYSISSSAKEDPTKVAVTAVMVRYAITSKAMQQGGKGSTVIKQGLATSWLQRLSEQRTTAVSRASGEEPIKMPLFHIPLYIRTSNFKLPADPKAPVVMVGPGTGVAPFRAFVRERVYLAEQGVDVGPTWLFYGCRHPDKDFLYKEEFEALERKAAVKSIDLKIFKAFSRFEGKKVYVQHMLERQGEGVWELLGLKGGSFYVCGDAKRMARDVNEMLVAIAQRCGMMSEDAGRAWVKNLKSTGRYAEDVWS
ncbi:hypothetical protein HDV00_007638 [Rhizophlyctis rosea]|nr:hypothetical protein HDV00_007638 [Rhizophlyctis rosea]